MSPVWAVHIADNVLTAPWWLAGFAGAAVLAGLGAWRLREEEIPRIALLTAAFFVASSIHIRIPPTSAHLLFNGLVGVLLGRRAGLAVVIGVTMQALLLGHGGFTTIGINSCVMGLPALLAWQLFAGLQRVPWLRHQWFRSGLVAFSTFALLITAVFAVVFLFSNRFAATQLNTSEALAWTLHPATLTIAVIISSIVAWLERRLENAPEAPLGVLVGEVTVLATLILNAVVLVAGGPDDWHTVALVVLIAQLPLAVVEGVVLGFTVGFLARVKPEMLGWLPAEEVPCPAEPLP